MNEQGHPFLYGRPVERVDELIDREGERSELLDSVRSGQPVMVYGPRRYGKTSLARVVEREAADGWSILAVHADLWGVSSIADVVGVLARSYARVSGVFRVRRLLPPEDRPGHPGARGVRHNDGHLHPPLARFAARAGP